MKALGAELVLTSGADGMKGAIARAEELKAANPGSLILQQFDNPANPAMHERTTGQEIWRDTDGRVDIFVAGVGTGGTVSGVGAALKANNPKVKIVAVEPEDSPVLSGGKPGPHKIQGIGAGFVPKNYNSAVIDEVLQVSNDDAIRTGRELAKYEGLLSASLRELPLLQLPAWHGCPRMRKDDCSAAARYGRTVSFDAVVCI